MTKFLWLFVLSLSGLIAVTADADELETQSYKLTVEAHCKEGEVGCSKITAILINKASGHKTELTGSTYMVKCADRVTPCHLGFYDLKSLKKSVRAYPNGTLEIESPESVDIQETGTWSH